MASVTSDRQEARAPGTADAQKIVMLDAGSSGVRAIDYCFRYDYGSGLFELISQSRIVEEITPLTDSKGLSNNMIDALAGIYEKRNCDGEVIHKHFFLGGTAGLRARQNAEKVTVRLRVTAKKLKKRNLDAAYGYSVRRLSGLEEAAFTWLAVNYITRHLNNPGEQHGVIELGGGSVQLAFRVPLDYGRDKPEDFVRYSNTVPEGSINIYRFASKSSEDIEVYGQSHLNFGLKSARERYQQANMDLPCSHQGEGGSVYKRCFMAMENLFDTPGKHFLSSTRREWSQTLIPKTLYLNGYFYDRTVALGLPGRLTVSLVKQAAEHICNFSPDQLHQKFEEGQGHLFRDFMFQKGGYGNGAEKQGFAYSGQPRVAREEHICAEMTYLSVLLEQLGITDSHILFAIKSLPFGENNYQYGISWPLGYAVAYANDWLPEFRLRVETTALALRTAVYAHQWGRINGINGTSINGVRVL